MKIKCCRTCEVLTMREKLIDLLGETAANCMPSDCLQDVADHLIANGVRLEEKQVTSDESKRWITGVNV